MISISEMKPKIASDINYYITRHFHINFITYILLSFFSAEEAKLCLLWKWLVKTFLKMVMAVKTSQVKVCVAALVIYYTMSWRTLHTVAGPEHTPHKEP